MYWTNLELQDITHDIIILSRKIKKNVPFFAIKKWGRFGKIIFIPKKIVGAFW